MMRAISDFLKDEKGAVTVDFVVWLPLFVSLLVIVTDASIIYLTQTEMWNVARDTVRRMTTRSYKTIAEAECAALEAMSLYSFLTYDVEAFSSQDINSVTIRAPIADASAFGYFIGPVLGETISATVTMRADPTITEAMEQGTCGGSGGGGGGGSKK